MTRLAFVVMTIFLTPVAMADDFRLTVKEDQQIIQIHDNEYKWMIDVDCRSDLKQDKETELQVHKNRIQVGKTIKVKQGKKSQNCTVKQLAVVSPF